MPPAERLRLCTPGPRGHCWQACLLVARIPGYGQAFLDPGLRRDDGGEAGVADGVAPTLVRGRGWADAGAPTLVGLLAEWPDAVGV